MNNISKITTNDLPSGLRKILFLFVLTVAIGYGFGLRQLYISVGTNSTEVEEHYLGNENNEDAEIMKFKKNEKELLTFLHDHLQAIGILLFLLTTILYFTPINKKLKAFLTIEPFISLLITFCGIYLLWNGVGWIKYIIPVTGFIFHASLITIIVLILIHLVIPVKK